jgi:hypothetical protein
VKRCSTRGAEVRVIAPVLASLVIGVGAAVAPAVADEPRRKVPLYTNEDLDRVSPYRDQTGGTSQPARVAGAPAEPAPRETRAGSGSSPKAGEAHWRQAWQRLQDRLQPLRDRAEALGLRIQERRKKPGVRPYSDPQIEAWQRQHDALRARMRESEGRFQDEARRAGALPGWLR